MKFSMKIFVLVALCLCVQFIGNDSPLHAASLALDPVLQGIEGPMVQMDEKAYDFGLAGGRDRIEHTFHVKNPGSESLQIHNVQTS